MLLVACQFLKDFLRIEEPCVSASEVKGKIFATWGFDESDVYLLYNGKQVPDSSTLTNGIVHAIPRLVGGKGGFGSMLRAIGAQIEKTTNREACRDLSGRRLRDINEEKRLKNWIAQQAEREQETSERKRRKLERLREEPKHCFNDEIYERERSLLTEKVSEAVEQGYRAAAKNNGDTGCRQKRKATDIAPNAAKKKKGCLWLDPDEEDLSFSSSDDDSGDDIRPQTSGKGGELVVNDRGPCDAVANADEGASSDTCSDKKPEDAVDNDYKIAVETANK